MSRRRRSKKHHMSRYHRRTRKGMGDFLDPVLGEVKGQDVLLGAVAGLAGSGLVQWAFNKITFDAKDKDGNAIQIATSATDPTLVNKKVGLLSSEGPLGNAAILAPAITGTLAGVALFMAQKQTALSRAKGHLVGAVAAGVGVTAWEALKQRYPASFPDAPTIEALQPKVEGYSNYVTLPSMSNYVERNLGLGLIGQNPSMRGVIANNPAMRSYNGVIASNPRLAQVTASAMMGGMGEYDMMDVFSE